MLNAFTLLYQEASLHDYSSFVTNSMRAGKRLRRKNNPLRRLTRPTLNRRTSIRPIYQPTPRRTIISYRCPITTKYQANQRYLRRPRRPFLPSRVNNVLTHDLRFYRPQCHHQQLLRIEPCRTSTDLLHKRPRRILPLYRRHQAEATRCTNQLTKEGSQARVMHLRRRLLRIDELPTNSITLPFLHATLS